MDATSIPRNSGPFDIRYLYSGHDGSKDADQLPASTYFTDDLEYALMYARRRARDNEGSPRVAVVEVVLQTRAYRGSFVSTEGTEFYKEHNDGEFNEYTCNGNVSVTTFQA